MNSNIITIDGPSGVGKGTLSRNLSDELGWVVLDSGSLYRMVGYLSLKNNTKDFSLHETERVNSLLVKNLSNKPLLILNGEIFDGAKQDRVANETVLVPANSSLEIKVSCVEQGRWAYKTRAFSRGKNMFNYHSKGVKDLHNNSAKHNQPSGSVQDNVWRSIRDKQTRMGVSSNTGSVNDTYMRFDETLSHLREEIIEEFNQALNLQRLFVKSELSKFNENSMHWI